MCIHTISKENIIPCDPDAPELPPPLKLGSPPPDPLSVYQDVTEISNRLDECIICSKIDQHCHQKSPDLNSDDGTRTSDDIVLIQPLFT